MSLSFKPLVICVTAIFISCTPSSASIPCHLSRTAAAWPSGATDSFGYDGLGNWTTTTNAEGRVYTMVYDALGRMLAATNAANEQVFANLYDPAGNVTNRHDGAGNTSRYVYDVLDLVTNLVYAPGKTLVRTYDADGNLSRVKDWLNNE